MLRWIQSHLFNSSKASPKAETSLPMAQWAAHKKILFYTLHDLIESPLDFTLFSYRECCAVPCIIRQHNERFELISATTEVDVLLARLEARAKTPITWAVAEIATLETLLHKAEQSLSALDLVATSLPVANQDHLKNALSFREIAETDSPIIQLVSSLLYDAWKNGASDIHFQTDAQGLSCLWRLDGVLVPVTRRDSRVDAEQIVRRIKILAELDIAEQRIPQDGRLKHSIQGHDVDFRVSVMPSLFGEDVVLRILDKRRLTEKQVLSLSSLGLNNDEQIAIRALSKAPYGLMLVTGPTGSGKTTSLYALIHEIHKGQDKFITIEDPVEYQLPGVLQIPVNDRKGLTFARGLRSILRHDPDCIMVGEIRDAETLDIAIQAALTGHRVFATLHANDTFEAIGRCLNLGTDLYSFLSALNGVVAQRLIRLLCPHCSINDDPTKLDELQEELTLMQIPLNDVASSIRRGQGCAQCRGTGYQGRQAIAEVLKIDSVMKELLLHRQSFNEVRLHAQKKGWVSLRRAAWNRVLEGTTSIDEMQRMTRQEDEL
ncbi:MAG: GspE/PulE family protein [Pseudomonadota bacterium]